MSNQTLQESLSALMDNEADELEIRRVLQSSESDPALRSTWNRYQLARAVMHKEPWQPKLDLSAGIAAVIADEPAPIMAEPKAPRVWQNLSRLAVAASVTMAVLVGVNMFNQDGSSEPAMVAELPPVVDAPVAATPAAGSQGGAVLAGFSQQPQLAAEGAADQKAPSAWQEQRIGSYLRQHAEHSSRFETPQLLPYARAASLESE